MKNVLIPNKMMMMMMTRPNQKKTEHYKDDSISSVEEINGQLENDNEPGSR